METSSPIISAHAIVKSMQKIKTISFTTHTTMIFMLVGTFMLLGGAGFFNSLVGSTEVFPLGLAGNLVVFFGTGIIHELVHGIGFKLSGVKPSYGAGLTSLMPYFYATSKEKVPLRVMLMTAYLPFVVLSIIFIALGVALPQYRQIALIGFTANFAGAVGDIWLASKLWKYLAFKDVMILDIKSGVEIYSSDKRAQEIADRTA
jgi:hypothetical protein